MMNKNRGKRTGSEMAGDLTERKQAEERLKLYSAAMDEAMDGVQIVDLDGRIMYSNKAIGELYGYRPDELVGTHVNELNADPDFASEAILPMLRQKGRWSGELLVRHKSGREFPVWLSASTVKNDQNKPIATVWVIRDITRRKQVEEDIRRNADVHFTINSILQVAHEDKPLDSILTQTLERILSIPWLTLESKGGIFIAEEGSEKLFLKVQKGLDEYLQSACAVVPFGRCLCGRAAMSQEAQYAGTIDDRHDIGHDSMRPHGHYCVPIVLSGKTLGVISLYLREGHPQDDKELEFLKSIAHALAGVIQRKRMEEEREKLIHGLQNLVQQVTRAKQEWQDTFDSIMDPIYLSDRDLGIVRANKAFYDFFGLDHEKALGRKCYAVLYGMDAPPQDCPHIKVLATGAPQVKEMPSLEGRRTLLVAVFPYSSRSGQPQGTISIMRDVTERKEQEQRLVITERLAALGRMASGIAHEINNPLAAIGGCAEGLLSRIERDRYDPEFFKNYLKIIHEEIFRCKSITTGMLSFVKKDTYENKDVDINALLMKTLEIIGFQGRLRNIEAVQRLHAGPLTIHGSEGELRQVFLAIITNALDAMQDNGTVIVSTLAEGDAVTITISDQGPGIPVANQSRIFDPFFTTKSDTGGTGLGLAIASKIITNHNGTISVLSEEGKGAAFTIRLPRERS